MKTYHFHIEGQVQGVGFRPFVHRLANKYGLCGRVSNDNDGVHIWVNEEDPKSQEDGFKVLDFIMEIQDAPPKNSIISEVNIAREDHPPFEGFQIQKKNGSEIPRLLLTPDLGLCKNCKSEINGPENRRNNYPFITCTNCGPRYSIIDSLPYDRERTSMSAYKMCQDCGSEYEEVTDRRFYSQTNSCKNCGIQLKLLDQNGETPYQVEELDQAGLIDFTVNALKEGKIVSIKGIGGFLLLADATNRDSVKSLRERKKRPSKPFALLYPDIDSLAQDAYFSKQEMVSLESVQAPIVLLKRKQKSGTGVQTELVAPGLSRLGCFLPYSGLLEMISNSFGGPLIATSGNFSGSPIYIDDQEAIKGLGEIADYFLCHDLEIKVPQDDSVVCHSYWTGTKVFLRRSRGFAPNLILGNPFPDGLLSMGAMMKSCFGITNQGNTYISQYLGDTDNFDVQKSYEKVLCHLSKLLEFNPRKIIVDLHPDYFSTRLGEELSRKYGVPLVAQQHHEAHFASVLGENNLLGSKDPILGVVWDGSGFGHDGHIWGGEFFKYHNGRIGRVGNVSPYDVLAGDRMSIEPKLPAFSLLSSTHEGADHLRDAFPPTEYDFLTKSIQKEDGLKTTSMGRLFDAVAWVLGFKKNQSYEGEAALFVQELAERAYASMGGPFVEFNLDEPNPKSLLELIFIEMKAGVDREILAAKFHLNLVRWIRHQATRHGCSSIAFSGGVFQNTLLVDLIIMELQKEFELAFHNKLSPNDECIPLGQIILESLRERPGVSFKNNSELNT